MALKNQPLNLTQDERYPDFVERYAFDCARFAFEVCGIVPTGQQQEMFDGVSPFGSRVSISSGHGTGKTSGFAIIALWHLLCYVRSNTILTAPKLETLHSGVWKELADLKDKISAGDHGWICDYFTVDAKKVYVNGCKFTWWVVCRTAPRGSPENLAGQHRDYLMWLCDEASGIPDANFKTITGSLTDKRNRMVMASQPTRPSGFFYDTQNSLGVANGGVWLSLIFNSEESPLVSDEFLFEKMAEYGGRDSVEYCIRVRGIFPENTSEYLLGRTALETRFGAPRVIKAGEHFGNLLVVDVGAGEYRDKTAMIHAHVVGHSDFGEDVRKMDIIDIPIYTNSRKVPDIAGEIFNYAATVSNVTVLVDAGGMGIVLCQLLEQMGMTNVVRIKWGNPCFKKRYQERFFNQRAMGCVMAAKAVKEGRITFPDQYKKEILDQGSRIPYHFDEKARYVIEKKENMKTDGIPSPDIWDTVGMAFLEDASYMIAEGDITISHDRQLSARDKAAEAMANIT